MMPKLGRVCALIVLSAVTQAAAPGDAIRLSGPMAPGVIGDVTSFQLTDDGTRAVYIADQDRDDVFELFSVPMDGSTAPIRLSPPAPEGADVHSFRMGAGDVVVFAATLEGVPDIAGVFSVPADGSVPPLLLHGPGIREFALAAGSFVVFIDDQERLFSVRIDGSTGSLQLGSEAVELLTDPASPFVVFGKAAFLTRVFYSAPADGSAPAVYIHSGQSREMRYAADGQHAYAAVTFETMEYPYELVRLDRVALDGSERRTLATLDAWIQNHIVTLAELPPSWPCGSSCLDPVVVSIERQYLFAVDADGSDLHFLAPSTTTAVRFVAEGPRVVFDRRTGIGAPEYLSIAPLDGSAAPTLLVPPGHPIEFWELGGTQVVYSRPGIEPEEPTFRGLYGIAIDGGQAPLLLNGPPLPNDGVLGGALLSASLQRAVFRSGTAVNETLLSAPLDAREPPHVLASMALGGHVEDMLLTPDGTRVVVRADRRADDVFELFAAPVDGSAAPEVLNALLPWDTQGDVGTFAPEFDQRNVIYVADQDEDGRMDLYRTRSDGQGSPVRLTANLSKNGDVTGFAVGSSTHHLVFGFDAPRAANPSRLFGARTEPLEGRLLDSTAGEILLPYALTPDGSRVVYRKGASLDDCDLFSCALDGSSPPVMLGDFSRVLSFEIAPAGDTVVFIAQPVSAPQQRQWLYAMPVDGSGAPIQLNAPAPTFATVSRFAIVPDGGRVLFLADQQSADLFRLFGVPIDGSQPALRLSGSAVFDVLDFAVTADGRDVVYRQVSGPGGFTAPPAELLAVPAAGGAPPERLTPDRRVEPDYDLSPDGQYAFFRSRARSGNVFELHVVRTDGTWAAPLRISGPLVPGGDVVSFQVAADGRSVVFHADERVDEQFELFRGSLSDPPAPVDDLPPFADVTTYRIDPRGDRVFYLADRDEDGRDELFAATLDGSTPPERVNGDLVAGGAVRSDFVALADGGVLYVADQELDETFELFHAPQPPPHLPAVEPTRSTRVGR